MTVAVVDYGAGNLSSVERALARQNAATVRVGSGEELTRLVDGASSRDASERPLRAVVLPGVGHFGRLAASLDARGLRGPLLEAMARGVPFLGVCLGMQALWEGSDEAPAERGLGLFPGRVTTLPATVKLPHMGWNRVTPVAPVPSRLLAGVPAEAYVYFAHSYAAPAGDGVVAVCGYGGPPPFAAVVERGNLFGVQFHPEKSGAVGARILANFLAAAGAPAATAGRAA